MKNTRLFLLAFGVLLFASCSDRLVPFTQDLYEEYRWTDEDLQKIQFYLSQDILLYRTIKSGDTEITRGEIRIRDGVKVEEIVIPAGTPGVFLFSPKANRMAISFEDGDKYFLMFGPNEKLDGRYVLLADKWEKHQGTVTYGGSWYKVDASDAFAGLMVNLKRARKVQVKRRVAEGRTVE
ncbi:MAG TPA: hypothetical protein ENJ88_02090 [Phaeodactylibacter sp.]|nr:hypothetical protein [Phaeodactylibacter sp.]